LFSQPSKEALVKDLDAYRDSIELKHINPFTKISRKEFSKEIALIKESSSAMNEDELMVALFKVNAKIGDEHTTVGYKDPQIFPLSLFWFEEGIYILSADTEYLDIIDGKIISVNNFSIDNVTNKISELIAGTNSFIKNLTSYYLCSSAILHGLKIIDRVDYCTLSVVKLNGDTIKRKVETKKPQEVKFVKSPIGESFLRNQSRENYWYRFDSLTSSLYFHYLRCMPDKRKPFKKFQEELFNVLETKQARRLIIDLRYNSGGSSVLLNSFIEKLWRTNVRKHNEVFVLIGRRTFSSAILNAFDLKEKDDAILIGEETGGSVNHFGEVNFFKLPNSGISVGYSTKYLLRDKNLSGSLKPDHPFPWKFSDFINGIDPALDYAKTH